MSNQELENSQTITSVTIPILPKGSELEQAELIKQGLSELKLPSIDSLKSVNETPEYNNEPTLADIVNLFRDILPSVNETLLAEFDKALVINNEQTSLELTEINIIKEPLKNALSSIIQSNTRESELYSILLKEICDNKDKFYAALNPTWLDLIEKTEGAATSAIEEFKNETVPTICGELSTVEIQATNQ